MPISRTSETLATHRAKTIGSILEIAFQTGYAEIDPQQEPLKVTSSQFLV
jgi:hypothetical protein